ncbi:MAG: hypothetical protein U1A77_14325 [Pirellulales bacterium]
MCKYFLGALLLAAALASPSFAQPTNIVMIRHGEKDPNNPADVGLTWQGKARAAALVPYFEQFFQDNKIAPPSFIFAQSAPSGHSQRPILTVTPYAQSLMLDNEHFVTNQYKSKEYAQLASDLLNPVNTQFAGKTVLICWEHKHLADMANTLVTSLTNGQYKINTEPNLAWPGGAVYGLTWTFAIDPSTKTATFQSIPQKLMYDDASAPPMSKAAKRE